MTSRIITDISNYIFVSDTPAVADAIFLPGGMHPQQPEYAARLWQEGYAKWIIPSGKMGVQWDVWPGVADKADIYTGDYRSECELFVDVLTKNGVPRDVIIPEYTARHTRDNAFLSRKSVDENGMKIKTAREGFFGIVNGGTVKNVAFTNVKSTLNGYAFVLANYLWKATIDNVYIETNTYNKDDRTNNPGFNYNSVGSGILASTAYQTKISNILIRMNKGPKTAQANFGALFGGTHSDEEFTCENVFVYVKQHFQYAKSNTAIVDEVETTTYTYETNNYYATMMTQHPAFTDEQVDGEGEGTGVYNAWSVDEKTGKNIKGLLYLAENQVADAKAETLAPVNAKILTQFYDLKVLKGVYYYGQNDTWGAYDPAGFLASGCWTAESGTRPAWGA
mgnify:CR=1 FL=1